MSTDAHTRRLNSTVRSLTFISTVYNTFCLGIFVLYIQNGIYDSSYADQAHLALGVRGKLQRLRFIYVTNGAL